MSLFCFQENVFPEAPVELLRRTCPPAAQAATKPYWPPSFRSLLAAAMTNRQPVAPNGCPRDSDPPQLLNFSRGGDPTWLPQNRYKYNEELT